MLAKFCVALNRFLKSEKYSYYASLYTAIVVFGICLPLGILTINWTIGIILTLWGGFNLWSAQKYYSANYVS